MDTKKLAVVGVLGLVAFFIARKANAATPGASGAGGIGGSGGASWGGSPGLSSGTGGGGLSSVVNATSGPTAAPVASTASGTGQASFGPGYEVEAAASYVEPTNTGGSWGGSPTVSRSGQVAGYTGAVFGSGPGGIPATYTTQSVAQAATTTAAPAAAPVREFLGGNVWSDNNAGLYSAGDSGA